MDGIGRYERRDDVAWLIIDRPERRNALSAGVVSWLCASLAAAKTDPDVRMVVLTGAGETNFSAGGDLKEMSAESADVDLLEEHFERASANSIFEDMKDLGKPIVARVQGLALAGGFGLALGCDFVIAADHAEFGLPEVRVGLWPYIITESLSQFMPPKSALQLMLTGGRVTATAGERLGFVYATAPMAELDATLESLLNELRAGSPQAMRLGKSTFYKAMDAGPTARMAMLESALTVHLGLPDAAEGMAAFKERRKPAWISATHK